MPVTPARRATKRVAVHQDDIGMCHGANRAFVELFPLGVVGSGSVMVPCPWFVEIAEMAVRDPRLDLGVHLTLNAEKPHYKWRPLTLPSPAAGLTDDNGFLWPDVASTRRHCHADAAEAEMRAQVDRALSIGIDVTHIDAHMGAALAPEYCDAYVRVGHDYALPILLTPTQGDYGPSNHLAGADEGPYNDAVAKARDLGFVIFDRVYETSWDRAVSAEELYRSMYGAILDGLTFIAMHFNAPGELEVIEPGTSHIRIDEYELFGSPDWNRWLATLDLEFIGFRTMRDELRAARRPRPSSPQSERA